MVATWKAEADQAAARGKTSRRHQGRHEGLHGRPLEGAGRADHGDDDEDALLAEPARDAGRRESGGREGLEIWQATDYRPPVVSVGDVADREGQGEHGQELREADEAEVEGASRQRVHLPAHRDGLDLKGQRARGARQRKRRPQGRS